MGVYAPRREEGFTMPTQWCGGKIGGREMKRRRPCARCLWREDENGNWETGCGETFCFDDGGVRPNKYYFCPACGKPIDEVQYKRRKYERD